MTFSVYMSHKKEVTTGQICLFCDDKFFRAMALRPVDLDSTWALKNLKQKREFFLTSWLKLKRTNPPFGSATTWNAARAGILETIQ